MFAKLCASKDSKVGEISMKKGIHPEYRDVIFKDMSCGHGFLTKSTAKTKDTIKWDDGKEYPLIKVEISSQSHPFYTGKQKMLDAAGQVEKFKKKFGYKATK